MQKTTQITNEELAKIEKDLAQAKGDVLILLEENDELKAALSSQAHGSTQTHALRRDLEHAHSEKTRAEQELARLRVELRDAQTSGRSNTNVKAGDILAQRLSQSEEVVKHLEQQVPSYLSASFRFFSSYLLMFSQLHSMHQLLTTTTDALNANVQRYESLKSQTELKDRTLRIVEEERLKLRRMVEVNQYKMGRLADRLQVPLHYFLLFLLFFFFLYPPHLLSLSHSCEQVTQKEKGDWKELFARAQHQLGIINRE